MKLNKREIAYIRIPHFAVAIERHNRSLSPSIPLILFEEHRERRLVYDCSSEAAGAGAELGMLLRQAEALCPEAEILPADESAYASVFEEWLEGLTEITPLVEPDGLGRAYLDASGLMYLYSETSRLCQRLGEETWKMHYQWPAIGLASCKFVSRTAALRSATGHALIVQHGAEREFLHELPVGYLPVSQDMQRRLILLGIRAIGQYGALHRDSITNQFGREGAWAHRLACGYDERPLVPRDASPKETAEQTFDNPIGNLDTLWATAKEMTNIPLAQLRSRLQVCQTIRVVLRFDNSNTSQRCLILREPTAGSKRVECLLNQLLRGFVYPCGVIGMRITLEDIRGESGCQLDLFVNERGQRDKLSRIIDLLDEKYGNSRFYAARIVDEEAFLPERRFALDPLFDGHDDQTFAIGTIVGRAG